MKIYVFRNRATVRAAFLARAALLLGLIGLTSLQTLASAATLGAARLTRINGIPTLSVDGAPLLVVGAQCDIWRSTRQDAETEKFFRSYGDMNATVVSVGIPWSRVETSEGRYDFRFLDWFLRRAESHKLKLVINLFNTNVCGKVQEGASPTAFPVYTPNYILSAPQKYWRMELRAEDKMPAPDTYDAGGPPMCPNDPNTLARERQYVARVAEHLKKTDTRRTVVMMQLNNEFFYNQWQKGWPQSGTDKNVRCHCARCEPLWAAGHYKNGEQFMFTSFARYVRALSDAATRVYPLPLYVNSPWWNPEVIPLFLDGAPNLALVGIDGVFDVREPNIFSRSQLGRNISFAAENPTENATTRFNLDVLPYYTLIGRQGIGNLLWEAGSPYTVIDDAAARKRYADALYPLKHAQNIIARARGTERIVGWFAVRDFASNLPTDKSGNFASENGATIVTKTSFFVREGASTRNLASDEFTTKIGDLIVRIHASQAGIIVQRAPREIVFAVPSGTFSLKSARVPRAESGRFIGERWVKTAPFPLQRNGDENILQIASPQVVRVTF